MAGWRKHMRAVLTASAAMVGALAGAAGIAAPAGSAPLSGGRQVLPAGIVPTHYDLWLSPDLDRLRFTGQVVIDLTATAATDAVTLNAKGLAFDRVTLDGVAAAAVDLDAKLDRVTFRFPAGVAPGAHRLEIAYQGAIDGKGTFGVFAMDYRGADGPRRTLATNFEPTGARTLLPCWDEPALKATFSVSVDAPKDRMAIGNMPVETQTPLPNGLARVRFATSPRLSTYLLFLGIGDYERTHRMVDGVDVGVVVKRGDLPRAAFALDQAAALLHYYDTWYGVRFPLPKLDLVAAPGEITGGSMENWGAIFYGQGDLLFDPKTSPEGDKQHVFLVVSHEMAHQWFGDLVTMAWWDNLWLNEGFARWMQTHAADALHPEWRTGLQAQRIYESGKRLDSGPGTHPVLQPVLSAEQATQAFDEITYDKGAAVIAMLEAHVGADALRDGVRRYMAAHAYGNTVDADLWREMPADPAAPVQRIERDFVAQEGLPLVRVEDTPAGTRLAEDRFLDDPAATPSAQRWHLPLAVAVDGVPPRTLVLDGTATLPEHRPLVNAGALGYARILYPPAQVAALAAATPRFADTDRLALLLDSRALGRAGYAPASDTLRYLSRLPVGADPIVWTNAVSTLDGLDGAYSAGPARDRFRAWSRRLLEPVAARVGMVERPGEDPNLGRLRTRLRLTLGGFGDDAVLAWAREIHAGGGGTAADRQSAREVLARRADAAGFDVLLADARATTDPLERGRRLQALAEVGDPALAARFVTVALGPDAPAGSAALLLGRAAQANPDAVWAALRPRLEDPALPVGFQDQLYLVPDIAGASARPERVAELHAWADKHLPPDTRQGERAAAADIARNARFAARGVPEMDRWITDNER